MVLLEGATGLLQSLLEGRAYGHDLAHGLHARRERLTRTLELLEGKARYLDHAVVDRGLEAGRRRAGDVVRYLVEGVTHREERRHLRYGKARRLGGEGRGAAHTGVHLDHEDATVCRVHRKLHVGATAGHTHALEDGQRVVAQSLQLAVRERLAGRDGDGVAGVDAHGVKVLDGAYDDAVAGLVAHDLHLYLLPALHALFDEHLAVCREGQALARDAQKLGAIVRHATTRAAQREGGTDHDGIPQLVRHPLALVERAGDARARDLKADVAHGGSEELPILAHLYGVDVTTYDLDAKALEHACLAERDGAVEGRLAAHVGKQRVGTLPLDDLRHGLDRDGLDVGAIGRIGVGHDRGRVRVHEHDLEALTAKGLAGLGAGVVELAGLPDDDGARSDDQDLMDVAALGHQWALLSRTSMAR